MPRPRWLLPGLVALCLLALAGTGGAIAFENNDHACDSCHTEPELTFVAQLDEAAASAIAPTLAAYHGHVTGPFARQPGRQAARCIDCHSGPHPILGRAHSLWQAAGDTLLFLTGQTHQPATLSAPFPDTQCTKCHRDDYDRAETFENHFHHFLDDPAAPTGLRCVDCHLTHQPANDFDHFILREPTFRACEQCHQVMDRGPTNMQP